MWICFACVLCVIAVVASPAVAAGSLRSGVLVRRADRPGFELRNKEGRILRRISTGNIVPETPAAESPDTRWLAFVSQDDFLWVISDDGRQRRRLVRAHHVTPVWSPDERELAIQANDGRAGEVGWPSGRLSEADLPGNATLTFSPDGWLWVANGDLQRHIQFQGVPPGASAPEPFGQPAPDDLWAGSSDAVDISPDGTTAAYLRYEGTGSVREALYEQPRGGAQRFVVVGPDFSHAGGHLAFSPDGGTIAVNWTTPKTGLFGQLWLIPAGGGAPLIVNLTTDLFAQPVWSPDGAKVAIGLPGGGVALVGRDGTVREPHGLGGALDPSWAVAKSGASRERICLVALAGLGLGPPAATNGRHGRAQTRSCSAWHPITVGGRAASVAPAAGGAASGRALRRDQAGRPQLSSCMSPPGAQPVPLFMSALGAMAVLQDRQNFCVSGGVIEALAIRQDSAVVTRVGLGALTYTLRIGTQTDRPRGSAEFEFGYQGISGDLATGAWWQVDASCDTPRKASCLGSQSSLKDFVQSGEARVDDWRLQAPHLGQRDRVTEFVGLSLWMWPNGYAPIHAASVVENATPRCDTIITAKGGCVFPDFIPTIAYSLSDPTVTQTAAHIQRAQLKGYPGGPGASALTRTMNRGKIKLNRRLACRNFKKMPGGSCDEYPFASTEQGQAFTHHSVSTEDVLLSDNVTAGRRLGIFYSADRVIDGDPFHVQITP